jgi:lysophospholipase L1-like esterase
MAGLVLVAVSGTLATVQQGTALANTREPAAEPPKTYYVAMGDSYSAGEGLAPYEAGTNTAEDTCHRSPDAFAFQIKLPGQTETVAQEAAKGKASFKFIACSGAETVGITKDAVYNVENPVYKANATEVQWNDDHNTDWGSVQPLTKAEGLQVNGAPKNAGALNKDTNLITITIGGNDIRFADVLRACALNNCAASGFTMTRTNGAKDPQPLAAMEPTVISLLKAHLEATFEAVHTAAPNAYILVAGYPLLFSGDPINKSCRAGLVIFNANEQRLLDEWGVQLDNAISTVVFSLREKFPIKYIDPLQAFAGHGICSKDNWVNGLLGWTSSSPSKVPSPASFHPTKAGQTAYAKLFNACLADLPKCS